MVDEIGERRWRNNTDPKAHKPVEALKAITRDIESGKLDAKHVTIVFCDQDGDIGWYQAGSLDDWGQVGILQGAAIVMTGLG